MAKDHGNVHDINDAAAWDAKLEEAESASKTVDVHFYATTSIACASSFPTFAILSKIYENLIFLKVDVDNLEDVVHQWGVRLVPTFAFINNRTVVDRVLGIADLDAKMKHYATTTVTASA